MATVAEGHRRHKSKSRKKKKHAVLTTVHDLPDHILERILLCLGPSPSLVRAAATCTGWCRVVSDAGFLARLRSAHPHATHAGNYHDDVDQPCPVFVPSLPLTVHGSRFSLDSFPAGGQLDDSRGSLLLFSMWTTRTRSHDLMVCEPLTGRHQGILWPSTYWGNYLGAYHCLLDGARSDAGCPRIGMSNFKIISAVRKTMACVFSSGSDGGWRQVHTPADSVDVQLPRLYYFDDSFVGRANGSLYFGIEGDATMLVLDETTAKFSLAVFPVSIWGPFHIGASRIITGKDGALRVIRVMNNDLNIFRRVQGDEWELENALGLKEATVGLPGHHDNAFEQGAKIIAANSEYILLTPIQETWLFSVELETLRVEREHERNKYAVPAYPYELPWPPTLPRDYGRGRRRR